MDRACPCPNNASTGCYETKNQGYWHTTYGIWQGNVDNILCSSHTKFLFRNSLSNRVIFNVRMFKDGIKRFVL